MAGKSAREQAIDRAMRQMYGAVGPDENEIDVADIRAILGEVFDAGAKAKAKAKASQP